MILKMNVEIVLDGIRDDLDLPTVEMFIRDVIMQYVRDVDIYGPEKKVVVR